MQKNMGNRTASINVLKKLGFPYLHPVMFYDDPAGNNILNNVSHSYEGLFLTKK